MKEFFSALFDLSFRKFITPQIAKFIYILSIIGSAVAALSMLRGGPLMVIGAPVFLFLSVVTVRCLLEVALAIFQIARYTAEVARRGRTIADETPPPPL